MNDQVMARIIGWTKANPPIAVVLIISEKSAPARPRIRRETHSISSHGFIMSTGNEAKALMITAGKASRAIVMTPNKNR